MGEFLSVPIKEKVSEDNENSFVNFIFNILVKIWSLWNAGMEKKNGGFAHQ